MKTQSAQYSGNHYKALIVDDEALARRTILTSLKAFPEVKVAAECSNGMEATEAILQHKPSLVFLDIQMPVMDGLEVINAIGAAEMPFVIFVTAYDQYAIEAFEKHAFDYLLKPYPPKRFNSALKRVLGFIEKQQEGAQSDRLLQVMQEIQLTPKHITRLAIRTTSRIFFLQVSEIDWVEAAGNYVEVHTNNEAHLLRETMTNLEAKLDPQSFLRIHRSAIINIDHIQEIQPDGHDYIVVLRDGKKLGMGRKYKEKLNRAIQSQF
ncbi:MAG: LytTR family DNA-binding domain-containing protein [Candidatus Hinthialibacter antarcticus]|nr:LytTR family DNA-binding domain-containing protein [Candidatus Hinthialibacter antarcticus]